MPVQRLTLDDVRVGDASHDADLPQDPLGQHGGAQDVGDPLRKGQSRELSKSRAHHIRQQSFALANQGIMPM